MATIASLAIKVSANIGDLVNKMKDVQSSVQDMANVMQSSSAEVRSLQSNSLALTTAYSAMTASIRELNSVQDKARYGAFDAEALLPGLEKTVDVTREAFGNIRNSVTKNAEDIAKGIGRAVPNIQNFQKACAKLTELRNLAQIMQDLTGDSDAMNDVLEAAQEGLNQLALNITNAKMEATAFNAVLAAQALPFALLSGVIQDIWGAVTGFFSMVNERLNGVPGMILKITGVLVLVIALIGYCASGTVSWAVAQAYLNALWQSNFFVVGLKGFMALILPATTLTWLQVAATNAWAAAQWAVNAAMAANPIILILSIILTLVLAIVYIIPSIVRWLGSSAAEAEQLENHIKNMEAGTKDFLDQIGKTADRYRELNNLAKNYNDVNMSGAEKYAAKLNEINEILNRPRTANDMIAALNRKEIDLVRALENAQANGQQGLIDSIQRQLEDLRTQRTGVAEDIRNAPEFTEEAAASAREAARLGYLQEEYGDLLDRTMTAQETYADVIARSAAEVEAGRMTQAEYATVKPSSCRTMFKCSKRRKRSPRRKTLRNGRRLGFP
ncbi:MAG: hypothetical protein LBQ54_00045 [Planctomycetaceae bacterium]|jgi:predicted  nucleic acid-binding Zn-ribbon protein|nr:hypothetical protein [Planctomycetaceae bacterium]